MIKFHPSGKKQYFNSDGQFHNEKGPAIVFPFFSLKEYWINGKRHRLDGPAIEYDYFISWWINDQLIPVTSQEDFERYIKLLAFT